MIIRDLNGNSMDAVLLDRTESMMRVAARGADDSMELTMINGRWVSEDLEPVEVVFEWQRLQTRPAPVEEELICSKELARRLVQSLDDCASDDDLQTIIMASVGSAQDGDNAPSVC